MSILSRTGKDYDDFALIRSTYNTSTHKGYDGITMNVHAHHPYSDPSIDRTNYNEADYSFLFGERNHIYPESSGAGAFGSIIHIHAENAFGIGYRIFAFQNQSFSGGYSIGNNSKETLIWGNTINLDCTYNSNTKTYSKNTHANDDDYSKYNMVFGDRHTIGYGLKYSVICGKQQKIGNKVEFVNVFGGSENTLGNYISDCTVFGYKNEITSGSSSSWRGDIYMLGCHLKTSRSSKVIVGHWNSDRSGSTFDVGTGSDENHRRTSFSVGWNSTDGHFVIVGGTKLTETKLTALLNLV